MRDTSGSSVHGFLTLKGSQNLSDTLSGCEFYGDVFLEFSRPRSGRKHKAWGVSPRIRRRKMIEPAERATVYENVFHFIVAESSSVPENNRSASAARSAGSGRDAAAFPGADAPGFMLSRAPRAFTHSAKQRPDAEPASDI